MFDWDEEQDSLLAAAEGGDPASQRVPEYNWQKVWVFVLAAAVIAAFAYEKGAIGVRPNVAGLGASLLLPPAPSPNALPQDLLVYTDDQAKTFLSGLRGLDAPGLDAYLAQTNGDIAHANPALLPFYKDARTLLRAEADRRAGPMPAQR